MVEFICDDKEIEITLRKLYKLIVNNGGVVHEKLTISCNKGDFQITVSETVPTGEEIIILSRDCLLPVDKFKLDLKGYNIVMTSHDKDLSEGQVSMMKMMIKLFNLTGKIEAQKKTSTFSLQYEDSDLLQRILKSRSEKGIPFLKNREELSEKTYYLKSFLKTRTLSIKGSGKETANVEVLMPVIDCLNHHAKAIRFTPRFSDVNDLGVKQDTEVTHVTVVKSCSDEGSNECYVNYGPYDSMDALIQYNYPDESAYFVRSVPVRIDLPGKLGRVEIQSMTWDAQHKNLPENLKDLEFYIPEINVNIVKDIVILKFLYIPSHIAPNAMRRILVMALSRFELNLEKNQMMEILRFVEKRIINENLKYYEDLSEYLKSYIPTPAVKLITENTRDVVATQLNHIKSYELLV